jgi:hypothetical protein
MATVFKFLSVICLLTLLACNNQADTQKSVQPKTADNVACKPYYQFDKIEHYFLIIEEDKLWKIEEKKTKTAKEKRQLELLIQYTPDKLSDTIILKDIEKIDFVKKEVPVDKFKKINEIFCQRKHNEVYALACIAIYRDILVFKKENKIIGTAKLCFSCDQSVITGTKLNTEEFGQSGDYKKLFQLLH